MTKNPEVRNLIRLLSSDDIQRQLQGNELLQVLGYDFLKVASGGDLYRADFGFQAPLGRVDFSGCNLKGANFEGANLEGANFDGAILDWAIFDMANLEGASFRNAHLHSADLAQTILIDTDFTGADVSEVNWWQSWGGGPNDE
jgi:uncharacterized protein YjbI with pentapeptide repeats